MGLIYNKMFGEYTFEIVTHIPGANELTLKHWETYGCVVSTVATDVLVLKHQTISILSTD